MLVIIDSIVLSWQGQGTHILLYQVIVTINDDNLILGSSWEEQWQIFDDRSITSLWTMLICEYVGKQIV